jgi:hypothetical protein
MGSIKLVIHAHDLWHIYGKIEKGCQETTG